MNKFSFWLWSINGILIFGLLATLIYNRPAWLFEKQESPTTNTYNDTFYYSPFSWGSVIFDKEKINSQHPNAEFISLITGTQENAGYTIGSLMSIDAKGMNQSNYQYFSTAALSNLVFSDATGKICHRLLDTPAYIHLVDLSASSLYNSETGAYFAAEPNYILYKISLEDTNTDGLLNEQDLADLYISEVDGKNLRKLTPDHSVCIGYDFPTQDHQTVRLSYMKKTSGGNIVPNTQQFLSYDVKNKTFSSLDKINEMIKALK
jgi:hypothetical protein